MGAILVTMPRVLNLDAQAPAPEAIAELSDHLRAGGVAVVPTDTLYGLAANALEARAVERVFALKGRGFDKALPIVVRDQEQAREVAARLPPLFVELADRFWPGPLTLILPAAAHLPAALTAGSGGIALRQPDLPLLAALLASTGFPLTATSANRSGEPACRTAAEVMAQLGSGCPLIADAGPSPSHLPSTIVDLCGSAPRLVRAGAVAADRLASYLKL